MTRDSSWADGSFEAGHPTNQAHEFRVSLKEMQLLQRLRQLPGGSYDVALVKTTNGREGLHSWRVLDSGSRTE
jgi:hypothetical protein